MFSNTLFTPLTPDAINKVWSHSAEIAARAGRESLDAIHGAQRDSLARASALAKAGTTPGDIADVAATTGRDNLESLQDLGMTLGKITQSALTDLASLPAVDTNTKTKTKAKTAKA